MFFRFFRILSTWKCWFTHVVTNTYHHTRRDGMSGSVGRLRDSPSGKVVYLVLYTVKCRSSSIDPPAKAYLFTDYHLYDPNSFHSPRFAVSVRRRVITCYAYLFRHGAFLKVRHVPYFGPLESPGWREPHVELLFCGASSISTH